MSNITKAQRTPNYLKLSFWLDPANHFWNTPMYSQKSREHYRDWLARLEARHTTNKYH